MTSSFILCLILASSFWLGQPLGWVASKIKAKNQDARSIFVLHDTKNYNNDNIKLPSENLDCFINKSVRNSLDHSVMTRRRGFLQNCLLPIGITVFSTSSSCKASTEGLETISSTPKSFVQGTVNLPPGLQLPPDTSSSALYVTARPNSPINVPKAILDGSNGKPPPVLASKIQNIDSFPCEFTLTAADLTLEGSVKIQPSDNANVDNFWWEGQDLIISSRWDTDGIAATRDPTDLVGRSLFQASNRKGVLIQLQGRGITGKLLTGAKK